MTTRHDTRRPRRDRGSMLMISLISVIVLIGIAFAYFTTSLAQSNRTFQDALVAKAMNVATFGVNAAILDLNEKRSGNLDGNAYYPDTIANRDDASILFNSTTTSTSSSTTLITDVPARATYSLGVNLTKVIGARPSGDFTTTSVLNADGTYTVTSSGVFLQRVATLQAILQKHPSTYFVYACFGDISLTLNGGIFSDSYNSANGNYASQAVNSLWGATYAGVHGDMGSNGDIVSNGSSGTIFGNVTPGPNHTFSGGVNVYGTTTPATSPTSLPPVIYSPPATNNNSSVSTISSTGAITGDTTLPDGVYRLSSITAGLITITGKVKIFMDGDIQLTRRTEGITIAPGGSLELYTGNTAIDLSGQGVLNPSGVPGNFRVYSGATSGTLLDLSGNSELVGAVYAPDAEVRISGNGQCYGSIVGKTITLNGGGNRGAFHYDEQLGLGDNTLIKYSIQSLRTTSVQRY